MHSPAFAAMVDRRTLGPEPWVSALQRLAEDVLESHATLHERIDKLSFRVQALWAYICSIERRTSTLEGAPESTDARESFLHELD